MRASLLYLSLLALSLPGDEQIALFNPKQTFIDKSGELAEELNVSLSRIEHWGSDEVTKEQLAAAKQVDDLLDSMSRGGALHTEELWSDDALRQSEHWEKVRELARLALSIGRWPDRPVTELKTRF